jgi:hypothetical protein
MLHEKKLPIAPRPPRQSLLGKDKSRKKDLLGLLFSSPPLHSLQGNQDIGRLLLADFGESLWVVVRGQSVTGMNSTASLKKQEWDGDGYPLFLASTISSLLSPFCYFFSAALLLQMAEKEPLSLQQISCVLAATAKCMLPSLYVSTDCAIRLYDSSSDATHAGMEFSDCVFLNNRSKCFSLSLSLSLGFW